MSNYLEKATSKDNEILLSNSNHNTYRVIER